MLDEHPEGIVACPPDPVVPPDTLARAFLRQLAQEERDRLKSYSTGDLSVGLDDDPVEDIVACSEPSKVAKHVPVPPVAAVVAILVARAIEAAPGLLRRLRRDTPIVTLATHVSDLVVPTQEIVRKFVFPKDASVVELTMTKPLHLGRRHAGLLARDGASKDDRPEIGNQMIGHALHAHIALFGIAPDPMRQLPRDLLRAAEYRLTLPTLDHEALDLTIEAVTGDRPTKRLDPVLLRTLDLSDLGVALRKVKTSDAAVDAIAQIVAEKAAYLGTGPSLEELPGYGEAKDWGIALAADLQSYRAGQLSWDDIDNRGLLLSGPPGVGKTQFARALAKTARVPLVATSVADWNASDHLGQTLKAIRESFAAARRAAPCILFIDEVDGISDRAQLRGEYVTYWIQIVNLFLELLAGIDERPGVVVIAATNHPEKIDAAVRRAGRLDREIAIEKPDTASLAAIFRHHLGPDALNGISLMPAALAARGKTGADVEAYVRRAKGAARRAARGIEIDDLLSEIRQGVVLMSGESRRRTAIHEAGHVAVAWKLGVGTIVDMALHDDGGTLQVDHALRGDSTLEELENLLVVLLAGRAAEALEFEAPSIGCGGSANSDLARATTIAQDIELRFGLGVLGPIYIAPHASDLLLEKAVLGSVVARLRAAEERATAIVTEARNAIRQIASALEKAAYLPGAEIVAMMMALEAAARAPVPAVTMEGA